MAKFKGSNGDDVFSGGAGKDKIDGRGGDDVLSGQAGDDKIKGGDGNDMLDGGKGKDDLKGGDGDDTLLAGAVRINSMVATATICWMAATAMTGSRAAMGMIHSKEVPAKTI